MTKNKKHWGLNLLIVFVLIIVALAFAAHYKNWTRIKPNTIEILSGVYYKQIPFSDINSISLVHKIPSMERINGFSALKKEKGIFKDSLNNENKVYVYVDNLSGAKIKIVYKDSLQVYMNFKDSIETQVLHNFLIEKTNPGK